MCRNRVDAARLRRGYPLVLVMILFRVDTANYDVDRQLYRIDGARKRTGRRDHDGRHDGGHRR
jgi:hypothetical protein